MAEIARKDSDKTTLELMPEDSKVIRIWPLSSEREINFKISLNWVEPR